MSVYLYLDGAKKLAKDMDGSETVHLGIRPYEMHAGNTLAIVAYPLLLCEELEKKGVTPKLTFILSLNDWEQDVLLGEDIYTYSFDVWPKNTTLEYSTESNGKPTASVWGKKIVKAVSDLNKRYPEVVIKPIYNSDLKNEAVMKRVILHTLNNQERLKEIMLKSSGKPTNNSSARYANALCPDCKHANTNTEIVENDLLKTDCQKCSAVHTKKYEELSFWLHHKPLFAARWKILQFSHSISGGDHYHEGDVVTRKKLYEFYFKQKPPELNMLFSPVLISHDGQKMSKSRGNYHPAKLDEILLLAKNTKKDKIYHSS